MSVVEYPKNITVDGVTFTVQSAAEEADVRARHPAPGGDAPDAVADAPPRPSKPAAKAPPPPPQKKRS